MAPPSSIATNIVATPDDFVGRAADVARLAELALGDGRLITLTGPGGIGKTRLALEFALDELAQGRSAWLVRLADATSVEAAGDAIAGALGIASERPSNAPDEWAPALAARGEMLLVLDGFDGLVAHAPMLERWLAAAPDLRLLVTSRERLKLQGEIVHEVVPLGLPAGDEIVGSEAVELFVRRVQRVRSGYSPTEAEGPFVASIVRALEGVPLAIELVAPRMAIMGARALLHRLPKLPALDDAIESAWTGLSSFEQAAFAQCSVFRGGFSVDAAEGVIALSDRAPPVLDLIQSLRDKSLLIASSPAAFPGEIRLDILLRLRAFAERKVDLTATRARHADWFARFADGERSSSRAGKEATARLRLEQQNLLAVVERVIEQRPVTVRTAEPALRVLLCLGRAFADEGPIATYRALLAHAIEATRDSGADPLLRAEALLVRGAHQRATGDVAAAARDLVQVRSIAKHHGDRALDARAVSELGALLEERGEVDEAQNHYELALAAFEEVGASADAADALERLGSLVARKKDDVSSQTLLARAIALHASEHRVAREGDVHRRLAVFDLDAGRYDDALGRVATSANRSRAGGDRRGEASAKGLEGIICHARGELVAARPSLTDAARISGELGLTIFEGMWRGQLGSLCCDEDRAADAYVLFGTALELLGGDSEPGAIEPQTARNAGTRSEPLWSAIFLAQRGALDADVGRTASAERAFARATAFLEVSRASGGLIASVRSPINLGVESARAVVALELAHLDPSGAHRVLETTREAARASALVRIAEERLLRRMRGSDHAPTPQRSDALVIGTGATWFRLPKSEETIALDRRRPLARLLSRLVRERVDRPGNAIDWDELLRGGWPDERVLPSAGAHRVRVALSTLRKLGLKDLLETTETGYRIAPSIDVVEL